MPFWLHLETAMFWCLVSITNCRLTFKWRNNPNRQQSFTHDKSRIHRIWGISVTCCGALEGLGKGYFPLCWYPYWDILLWSYQRIAFQQISWIWRRMDFLCFCRSSICHFCGIHLSHNHKIKKISWKNLIAFVLLSRYSDGYFFLGG